MMLRMMRWRLIIDILNYIEDNEVKETENHNKIIIILKKKKIIWKSKSDSRTGIHNFIN